MPKKAKEKRVILLIVEGKSDQVTLENAFRRTLMERYPSCNAKVHVIHGDGTLKRPYGSYIVSSEAIKATNALVRAYLQRQSQYNGIKPRDILGIAQITDLDACFADAFCFVTSPSVSEVMYDVSNHQVLSPNGLDLIKKREAKQQNLLRLNACDHMTINKAEIPYQLFYFGIDLECALYGRVNCTDDEKESLSNTFDDQYGVGGEPFLERMRQIPILSPFYRPSWDDAGLKAKAFDPLSNFLIIFDWIQGLMARQ